MPSFLRWLYKIWMKFSHGLGYVMSRILLTIMWILGIGFYSIVLKIVRLVRPQKKGESEWVECAPQSAESLTTQY